EAQREEPDLFGVRSFKEEPVSLRHPLSQEERLELDSVVRSLCHYACWRLNPAPDEEEESTATSENRFTDLLAGLALNDRPRPTASDYERTAQLIRHWPTDRLLDVERTEIRDVICRLATISIEVFFTERFLRLAKPGGFIAVIVPESIVASDRLSTLRRWLACRMDLLAIVSLPQRVFSGVGANAKTTILFARRVLSQRPEGWWLNEQVADANRKVLLTAPRLNSPNWSLEGYLNSILEGARDKNESEFDSE